MSMIKSLRLKNYRCFDDVTVEFGDFNVLIGPNGTGKTALCESLLLMKELAGVYSFCASGWGGHAPEAIRSLWATSDAPVSLGVDASLSIGSGGSPVRATYDLVLEPGRLLDGARRREPWAIRGETLKLDGRLCFDRPVPNQLIWLGDPTSRPIAGGDIQGTPLFGHLLPDGRRSESDLQPWIDKVRRLRDSLGRIVARDFRPEAIGGWTDASATSLDELVRDGGNLSSILDYLRDVDVAAFNQIEKELRQVIPDCEGLAFDRQRFVLGEGGKYTPEVARNGVVQSPSADVPPVLRKRLAYRFTVPGSAPRNLSADLVSSGMLLFTAYLTMAVTAFRPSVLIVEEPETGVHPGALRDIVSWLRRMTEPRDGQPGTQVIITTHSPYLLDLCKPEEVLVLNRPEGGRGTKVVRMSDVENIGDLLSEFQVGELWTSMSESEIVASAERLKAAK